MKFRVLIALVLLASSALALDPSKSLSQYTRTVWTQAQGLPQDTVRAIAQTPDGYLWLGTNEGLARFDGYEFVTYTKDHVALPGNSINNLWVDSHATLWIGTNNGLGCYSAGQFKIFSGQDGLPPGSAAAFAEDSSGAIWLVAGGRLARYEAGKFTVYPLEDVAPVESISVVYIDPQGVLWAGGIGGVVKRVGGKFVRVLGPRDLRGNMIRSILQDSRGTWLAGINGVILIRPDGSVRRFTTRDGLPNVFVLALREDRAGNLWVGTYGGLSRFEKDRFVSAPRDDKDDRDWVWALFEDREGDLWVGANHALNRLRDDRFTMYGRSEDLPSDEPTVIHQDARGQIWVGYHDSGLLAFSPAGRSRLYTTRDGLPSDEMFALRDARNGDLLIASRAGVSRLHDGRFTNYLVPDPVGRTVVYDVLEDSRGRLWAAATSGVYRQEGTTWRSATEMRGSGMFTIALAEDLDGSMWVGTLSDGLWHLAPDSGTLLKTYSAADGLDSDSVRALYLDPDGALWIGTQGGGLSVLRNGALQRFGARDGLLSDTIAHVEDDGHGFLWLSTPRGICRIGKQQLLDFAAGKVRVLTPENFGVEDGLRSAQAAPGTPTGGGGTRTRDGHLWFPTGRGIAMVDPNAAAPARTSGPAPAAHILEVTVNGQPLDLAHASQWQPGTGRVQFRYTGIDLNAPERVQYSYKLEGLDPGWISAGARRVIDYNPLPHGRYRFLVRAALPGGETSQAELPFEVLPRFYETKWFAAVFCIGLAGAIYGIYRLRLRSLHARFALITEERARIAREIHDTLAQGFVGISAQLDALAIRLNEDLQSARQHLNLAQKMARHSLTEARRSVMDLRATDLQEQDLPAALVASTRRLVAGTPVELRCDVADVKDQLAPEAEQNVLRIAQEAVANAVKHARPATVHVELGRRNGSVYLRVKDDGKGFEMPETFSASSGQFGILGMRERAARCRGDFELSSTPGAGTQVEVKIPVCTQKPKPVSVS